MEISCEISVFRSFSFLISSWDCLVSSSISFLLASFSASSSSWISRYPFSDWDSWSVFLDKSCARSVFTSFSFLKSSWKLLVNSIVSFFLASLSASSSFWITRRAFSDSECLLVAVESSEVNLILDSFAFLSSSCDCLVNSASWLFFISNSLFLSFSFFPVCSNWVCNKVDFLTSQSAST